MPIFCGTGLNLKNQTLAQTDANITEQASRTFFSHRKLNQSRRFIPHTIEFSVGIFIHNSELNPAMEFAGCVNAANRPTANDSYLTKPMGKVASYESPHCI